MNVPDKVAAATRLLENIIDHVDADTTLRLSALEQLSRKIEAGREKIAAEAQAAIEAAFPTEE